MPPTLPMSNAMTPTDLHTELQHRQSGYAWARRFIAGLTICLALIAGIMDRDAASPATTNSASTDVIVTPATPGTPECPSRSAVISIERAPRVILPHPSIHVSDV